MHKLIKVIFLLTIVFSLFACGGGGGGDSANNDTTNQPVVDPVTQPVAVAPDIQDGYTLTATKITYSTGQTVTEKDINVSGHMNIYKDSMVQTITINDISFTSDVSYTIDWNTDFTGGTIHMTTGDGIIHDITFTYSSTDKSITTYSGVVTSNGVTFEEWDIWAPIMPMTVNKSQSSVNTTSTQQDDFIFIGNHLKGGK